jgi:hypothetical protein
LLKIFVFCSKGNGFSSHFCPFQTKTKMSDAAQGFAANIYFLVESKTVFAHIYPVSSGAP